MPDYSILDKYGLGQYLFYPRPDIYPLPAGAFDVSIPVAEKPVIGCRFYQGHPEWPWIIYFHGNGEVASDYNDIAPFYQARNLNLVVAEYRGYGASTGQPGFANMLQDAHTIFRCLSEKIKQINSPAELYLMGRSLGSTSALELAAHYQDLIAGLIIESGFASVTRLIKHLNLPAPGLDLEDLEASCLAMIGDIKCPALIMHGEYDILVPFPEGELIYSTLGSFDKTLVKIPQASHNDIMFIQPELYFSSLEKFIRPLSK